MDNGILDISEIISELIIDIIKIIKKQKMN